MDNHFPSSFSSSEDRFLRVISKKIYLTELWKHSTNLNIYLQCLMFISFMIFFVMFLNNFQDISQFSFSYLYFFRNLHKFVPFYCLRFSNLGKLDCLLIRICLNRTHLLFAVYWTIQIVIHEEAIIFIDFYSLSIITIGATNLFYYFKFYCFIWFFFCYKNWLWKCLKFSFGICKRNSFEELRIDFFWSFFYKRTKKLLI